MADKQTRVGIYARVSTTDKTQDVDVQLEHLREIAHNHNWFIYDQYYDELSAVKYRPAIRRLLTDVKKRKIDTVLVSRIDRLARSVKDLVHLVEIIVVENSVRLWFVDQSLDVNPKNPVNMLLVHMLGAIAEFERQLISERVKAGMAYAAKNGTILGQPRKYIDLDKLKELRLEGKSLTELQREFKASRMTIIKRLKELGLIVNPMANYKDKLKDVLQETT